LFDRPWIEPRELNDEDFRKMRLPEKYWDREFEDLPSGSDSDKNPAKTKIAQALDHLKHMYDKGLGYYIWGQNGVGKTTAGSIILKAYKRRAQTCLFLKSEQIRSSVFEDADFDGDHTLWEWANNVGVLLIDDIGKEYRKEGSDSFSDSKMFDLIRERISNNRPTWITGNPSPDTLRDMYTKSFTTLFGTALMPVEARGPDLRVKQAREQWDFLM
jgi:DNA replication protein DnaC